jgi:hypothetical protein
LSSGGATGAGSTEVERGLESLDHALEGKAAFDKGARGPTQSGAALRVRMESLQGDGPSRGDLRRKEDAGRLIGASPRLTGGAVVSTRVARKTAGSSGGVFVLQQKRTGTGLT